MANNITVINGNIFNTKAQTTVNTVNCVGVIGKGIALVFKLRYPSMFEQYQKYCIIWRNAILEAAFLIIIKKYSV